MTHPPTTPELPAEHLRELLDGAFTGQPTAAPVETIRAAGQRRLRRHRTAWAAGAMAAIVCAATGGLLITLRTPTQPEPTPASHGSAATIPSGWRTLHWQGTTFAVPPNWTAGDPTQWCVSIQAGPPPMYSLPNDGGSTAVACSPQHWYGAAISPAATLSPSLRDGQAVRQYPPVNGRYPGGAWFASVPVAGGGVLVVVTHSKEVAQQIVSSVEPGPRTNP